MTPRELWGRGRQPFREWMYKVIPSLKSSVWRRGAQANHWESKQCCSLAAWPSQAADLLMHLVSDGDVGKETWVEMAWGEQNPAGEGSSFLKVQMREPSHACRPGSGLWEITNIWAWELQLFQDWCSLGAKRDPHVGEASRAAFAKGCNQTSLQRGGLEPPLVLPEPADDSLGRSNNPPRRGWPFAQSQEEMLIACSLIQFQRCSHWEVGRGAGGTEPESYLMTFPPVPAPTPSSCQFPLLLVPN